MFPVNRIKPYFCVCHAAAWCKYIRFHGSISGSFCAGGSNLNALRLTSVALVVFISFAVRRVAAEDAKPYTESIPGTDIKFDVVPIPGGTFTIGSPDGEAKRGDDEGPQHDVEIKPFFMGKCEVTWDEFDIYSFQRDLKKNDAGVVVPSAQPA